MLDGRYRLIALLGSGAHASTYLADDVSLQRQVAVRVLNDEYANDQSFRERFAAEARAIAGLSHPAILRVYDWSDDPTHAFVVLEYVEGGSLKTLLNRQGMLSVSQVVAIGIQAARALASAHASGITHGAIKPANLLFDGDDRLRLTDFSPIEGPKDPFATGTTALDADHARYASPEEALGATVDQRADVYALALVLYEAVTGSLPFEASSPITTLMARVGVALPHHPALGPLDQILAYAAAPDPDARLDAATLADRLEALATTLLPPGPLNVTSRPTPTLPHEAPTVVVESTFGVADAPVTAHPTGTTPSVPTTVLGATTIGFTAPSASELTGAVPAVSTNSFQATGVLTAPLGAAFGEQRDANVGERHGDEFDAGSSRRRLWWWLSAGLVLVLLAVGVTYAVVTSMKKADIAVPSVVGMSKDQAASTLGLAQLTVDYGTGTYSVSIPRDQVIGQDPAASTMVKEGDTVTLRLSLGPPLVTVPSVLGLTCPAAEDKLATAQLSSSCPTSSAIYSATVPPGQVVSYSVDGVTNPASVPQGAVVVLAVSSGSAPTAVPDVSGQTQAAARDVLTKAGFTVTLGSEFSSTVPVNSVTRTMPAAGSALAPGSSVTIYLSTGPAPVVVPNLVGLSGPDAVKALTDLGLSPNVIGTGKAVSSQDVSAGTSVPAGTTVSVTLS
jgi:serine/threonine-protein kinase